MRPMSRLRHYINYLLTYLLTFDLMKTVAKWHYVISRYSDIAVF